MIDLREVDAAFREFPVENVTVVRKEQKCWYFTFEVGDPSTGKAHLCTMQTQRGELRCWADPRSLFSFLSERYSVRVGQFKLEEETKCET